VVLGKLKQSLGVTSWDSWSVRTNWLNEKCCLCCYCVDCFLRLRAYLVWCLTHRWDWCTWIMRI
jgi:hypothetical protein